MTAAHPGFSGPPALVPGELRGYRRFRLTDGALHPTVHHEGGPWSSGLEQAVCAAGADHPAPAPDCGCGLYGWYDPADARTHSGFGDVTAVVAAQGRTILGDHGFRAERARVEAVALPRLRAGLHATRATRRLADTYPQARVYRSSRRMLREHRPHDLRDLGITASRSPAARYRTPALVVWLLGILMLYAVVALPRGTVAHTPAAVWVGALVGFLGWQAALVWLAVRCSSPAPAEPSDSPAPAEPAPGPPSLPPDEDDAA